MPPFIASFRRLRLLAAMLMAPTLLSAMATPAVAAFTWTASNNNNWDNNGNWTGQSGFPDDPADDVIFNSSAATLEVDLRGGDRDIGKMNINLGFEGGSYSLVSNNGGMGTLRINGDIAQVNLGNVTFADTIRVFQSAPGTWSGNPNAIIFDAQLFGTADITNTSAGITFNAANPYSGNFTIGSISNGVTLGNANAFHNALVTIKRNNGLNLNSLDANIGALAGSGNINLGSQTVTVGDRNTATTYSGNLSGTGNLVKLGTADWTLSGNNNFTGTVTVGDGVSTFGSITVGSDTALVNNTVTVRTLNGLRLAGVDRPIGGLAGGGSVVLDAMLSVGSNNTDTSYGGSLEGTGSLEKVGTGILTLSSSNSYTGGTVLTDGTLRIDADNRLGATSGNLTYNGGQLIANGAFTIARDIDFASATSTGRLRVTGSNLVQLDGVIAGGTDNVFSKTGPGTLQLNAANTFPGTFSIQEGAAQLGNANIGVGALQGSGDLVLGAHTLSITDGQGKDFSGVISGTGGLTKTGPGAQTLGGANTFSGDTVIDGGSIILGNADALQNSAVHINVDNGLDPGGLSLARLGGLTGNGDLALGSTTLVSGLDDESTTYAGDISGDKFSALAQSGAGTLTLTGGTPGTPSVVGYLFVDHGGIVVTDAGALRVIGSIAAGDTTGPSEQADLTIESGATVDSKVVLLGSSSGGTGQAMVTGAGSTLSTNNITLGGDSVAIGGTGVLAVDAAAAVEVAAEITFFTNASSITIDGGTLAADRISEFTSVLGTIAISDPITGPALTIGAADGSSTFNGVITDAAGGPGSMLKTGAGTLTLGGANTFTGPTQIDGGSILLGDDSALQNSTVNINIDNGLNLNGLNATIAGLAGSGDLDLGASALTVVAQPPLSGLPFRVESFGGAISGAGSLSLNGLLSQTLGGDSTYSGGTIVNVLGLSLAHSNAVGTGPIHIMSASSLIDYHDGVEIANPMDLQAKINLAVSDGAAATQSGAISETGGSFGIAKTGGGTLTLTSANTYTGLSNLVGGTLVVADNNALGTGTLRVSAPLLPTLRLADTIDLANAIELVGPGTIEVVAGSATLSGAISEYSDSRGITKTGTGTLTLSGANTYTGDTIINGGTLSLAQAFLADSADVLIDGAALLDLDFVGTDLIDALFVDGLSKNVGTYGAPGSGADFEWSVFTGTGLLQVSIFEGIPGDFDADGDVDGADFITWQRNPSIGNLADWQTNYGMPAPLAASTAVPEPTSLLLVLGATLCFSCRRRCIPC